MWTKNMPLKLPHVKIERKKFTPQNHSLFRSISCFGVTKITTPIWLQKSWKYVNRSLKKRQRPNTIQILWIVKNQEHRNIATLSISFAAIINNVMSPGAAKQSFERPIKKFWSKLTMQTTRYKPLRKTANNCWNLLCLGSRQSGGKSCSNLGAHNQDQDFKPKLIIKDPMKFLEKYVKKLDSSILIIDGML